MSTSRRDFLKSSIIAGAGVAGASVALPRPLAALTPAGAPPPVAAAPALAAATPYTRGIGAYPGAASQNFSPSLALDTTTYRNLALLRPAYHSSSYDYNLTAQLVTDGIKDTRMPTWVAASVDTMGTLLKQDREVFLDHFPSNTLELKGTNPIVQLQFGGGEAAPTVDRVAVFVVVPDSVDVAPLSITVSISDDGREWKQVASSALLQPLAPENYPPDLVRGARLYNPMILLQQICHSRYYQVQCHATHRAEAEAPARGQWQWRVGQVAFYSGDERVQLGGPYTFTSAWMSAGLDEEWVYVDLGGRCEFDRVTLHWIARAAEGLIQVSDDAHNWRNVQALAETTSLVDDIHLPHAEQARYVRVLMTRPSSPDGYVLSEFEVYGRGGPVAHAKPAQTAVDGRLDLAGGAWKLQRDTLAAAEGPALSQPGFKDEAWVLATVPGTVLTSYLNVEAIPDPDFGKNQLYVSDSFFYADFWYRTEFTAPVLPRGEMAWLNFDGVNWKADVFLNGEKLGRIEGGFTRARFDVTAKMKPGAVNALAVKIEKNATPGSCKQKTFELCSKNGGALGADNPTYHSSIGWDWISTIRGRNTGIWGDVYLDTTGSVTLENQYVTTAMPLPDVSSAEIAVSVDVVNHQAKPVTGTVRGKFGTIAFEQRVTIPASSRKTVTLDKTNTPGLHLQNPELWWPVGYGEPHLYDVEIAFQDKRGKALDRKQFKAGIRQMTATEEGGKLRLFINGRRFIASGGNWGFGESMLRYRAREYDAAVRYHREMGFTMIRNWVGQIPDDAFYEACDRHGVVVWQDFWLANPWDGPVPEDNSLFLANARDTILRIRNHASIGLYCGRNEWFPPAPLEAGIRKLLGELHAPIHYIGSSADDVVSGHGPYQALPPTFYFRTADTKLHSEIGMPNIPPIESVRAMMPEAALWPQALEWGIHDFCLQGAMAGTSFRSIVEQSYGGADSAEEWITLAQFVNYEGYRAMFEAQSKYRMGLLLWMSHPCWPSFVWQTYDYYFEPTAAYFGCKKACEPLHIQWNRDTETIEVVNYSAGNQTGLTAQVEVLNMHGKSMWTKTAALDSKEDSTSSCIPMEYPSSLSPVHFLRLTLTRGSDTVSSNFYLRGLEEGNYRAIRQLPRVQLHADTKVEQKGDHWLLTTELHNPSPYPALMTRLKAVRETSGDRILPAIYSDNYVTLMPNERRVLTTEVQHADTRGEGPRVVVSGFNIASA